MPKEECRVPPPRAASLSTGPSFQQPAAFSAACSTQTLIWMKNLAAQECVCRTFRTHISIASFANMFLPEEIARNHEKGFSR